MVRDMIVGFLSWSLLTFFVLAPTTPLSVTPTSAFAAESDWKTEGVMSAQCEAQRYATSHGYVGGYAGVFYDEKDDYHTQYTLGLIKRDTADWVDVAASEVDDTTPEALGRSINGYAAASGYVGGFPTFCWATYPDRGLVYGALLLKSPSVEFQDIPEKMLDQIAQQDQHNPPGICIYCSTEWKNLTQKIDRVARSGFLSSSYKGGVPTYNQANYNNGQGRVFGALLFTPDAIDLVGIPATSLSLPACQSHAVYGGIGQKYQELGAEKGALGCALTDEQDLSGADQGVRTNYFAGGQIIYFPADHGYPISFLTIYQEVDNNRIVVMWEGGADYDAYQIIWWTGFDDLAEAIRVGLKRGEADDLPGGMAGIWFLDNVHEPITHFYFQIEGCTRHFLGSSDCSRWAGAAAVRTSAYTSMPSKQSESPATQPDPQSPKSSQPTQTSSLPPPSISVTSQGSRMYHVIGNNLIANQDVYLRIVDGNGQGVNNYTQHQWIGKAREDGTIDVSDIWVTCIYTQMVYFSIHDERIDPNIQSLNLYSNIEGKFCQ